MTRIANYQQLAGDLSTAVSEQSEPHVGKWVNGRIVAVLASPELGNAEELALGMSVLAPGVSTPRHDHRAEEIAIILSGTGQIELGDEVVAVRAGDIVRTPPHLAHMTTADESSELQVLWMYAPAGSESRWLQAEPKE